MNPLISAMNSEEKQIIHFCEIIYENKDLFHGTD
jgi:hypothetical protein